MLLMAHKDFSSCIEYSVHQKDRHEQNSHRRCSFLTRAVTVSHSSKRSSRKEEEDAQVQKGQQNDDAFPSKGKKSEFFKSTPLCQKEKKKTLTNASGCPKLAS